MSVVRLDVWMSVICMYVELLYSVEKKRRKRSERVKGTLSKAEHAGRNSHNGRVLKVGEHQAQVHPKRFHSTVPDATLHETRIE